MATTRERKPVCKESNIKMQGLKNRIKIVKTQQFYPSWLLTTLISREKLKKSFYPKKIVKTQRLQNCKNTYCFTAITDSLVSSFSEGLATDSSQLLSEVPLL